MLKFLCFKKHFLTFIILIHLLKHFLMTSGSLKAAGLTSNSENTVTKAE